jgi:hypothetical protein
MDEDLQRLVRQLREDVCPQRVRDEVARRISRQPSPPSRFRFATTIAIAALVLLGCLVLWQRTADNPIKRQPQLAQQSSLDRAQVVAQAEGALGIIGDVLLDAGAHSEKAIIKGTLPPLRNSFETTKDKINHLINQ